MFNPFKKKDNGFSLDENPLPTISETSNLPNEDSANLNSISNDTTFENPNQNINQTPMDPIPQNSNPFMSAPIGINNEVQSNDNQDLHNDLIKTKIDSLESKTSLIEAKISNIENKLDLIYKLLLEEVSEDTKRKFKVDSMMRNIR